MNAEECAKLMRGEATAKLRLEQDVSASATAHHISSLRRQLNHRRACLRKKIFFARATRR
jgi:hypothetical protein